MQCQAKSKQSGEQCKRHAVAGKRVCSIHGGKTPGGLASPHTRSGRYSKYLPTRMADKYNQALADPELLNLREEVSLVDARLADLIGRVDTGESGALWQRARGALTELSDAIKGQNAAGMLVALTALENVIKRGQGDYATWGEISAAIEQRRRLVESERKRLVEMQQMITYERAALMFSVITDAIRRNVQDPQVRRAIAEELRAVWQGGAALPVQTEAAHE